MKDITKRKVIPAIPMVLTIPMLIAYFLFEYLTNRELTMVGMEKRKVRKNKERGKIGTVLIATPIVKAKGKWYIGILGGKTNITVRKNRGTKATQYIARLARKDFCSRLKELLNSM